MTKAAGAPNQRSFTLNSREFHQAVARRTEAWIANGALPREPRPRDLEVIVEARRKG
jgi:hypothetical protein